MSAATHNPLRGEPLGMPDEAWLDWGGDGPPLHFGHANGFPPGTYAAFLSCLRARYHVCTLEARPLWPGSDPAGTRGWETLVQDLRAAVDRPGLRGGIGMGHSLGAICTLRAAVEDPGLFRALVLIDPSFFTGPLSFAWGWLQRLRRVDRTPIVAGALRRRDRWASRQEARAAWRDKPLFKPFCDECFDAYLDTGLADDPEGGLRLRYPKKWEAAIFRTTPADPWNWVRRSPVPTLLVRGETSQALSRAAARKFGRLVPQGAVIEVPGTGHMLPLEQPGAVADTVVRWLDGLDGRTRP